MSRRSNLPQYQRAYACEDEWTRRRDGGTFDAEVAVSGRLLPISAIEDTDIGMLFLSTTPPRIRYLGADHVPEDDYDRFLGWVGSIIGKRTREALEASRGSDSQGQGQQDGRVYFVQAGDGGNIKIGVSGNPETRVAGLQTGSDEPLRILATIPGGRAVEKELHRRFAALRVKGEWFRPEQELLDLIRTSAEPA